MPTCISLYFHTPSDFSAFLWGPWIIIQSLGEVGAPWDDWLLFGETLRKTSEIWIGTPLKESFCFKASLQFKSLVFSLKGVWKIRLGCAKSGKGMRCYWINMQPCRPLPCGASWIWIRMGDTSLFKLSSILAWNLAERHEILWGGMRILGCGGCCTSKVLHTEIRTCRFLIFKI